MQELCTRKASITTGKQPQVSLFVNFQFMDFFSFGLANAMVTFLACGFPSLPLLCCATLNSITRN